MLQPSSIGSMNFNVLRLLIEEHRILLNNVGAEVGVLYGDTSDYLLRSFPSLSLISIDPFLPYKEVDGERSAEEMARFESIAGMRLREHGTRSKLFKATSLEVAGEMAPGKLDFVFIDANHSYEAVKEDLEAWYPKIRKGGLFSGHDYQWEGVRKAVDEFFELNGLEGFVTPPASDIWYALVPCK
jgi:hypothetical protein